MTRQRTSSWVTIALASATIVAVGAGVVFARADQAVRIGRDARDLSSLERISAQTATHRASLVVAFAAAGVGDWDTAGEAADEAVLAAEHIVELAANLEVLRPSLALLADQLATSTTRVLNKINQRDPEQARDIVETDTLPNVQRLATNATDEATVLAGRIDSELSEAGRLARAASFVVAFLVPAMTVVGFRRVIRRRAERDRLEQELTRQKELTETKDRLIAGLSHQLRTPITGIYGFADLLLSQPDHELATEGIESIFRESGELRRMVDDILVAARITADNVGYRTQPTPATQVIDRALIHFHRLGARIKVDTQDAVVQVDGARLEHALRNLVANAIRHGSEPIEVLGCARGDSYQVIVRDVGPGLGESPALEPFRPYFHDLESVTVRGSLGLGLSVARTLVEAMDGSIAYSRVNGATEFTVTVPLTKT